MNTAEKILEVFSENNITLSLAESCTGGALAASLTAIPGASNYFLGSAVVYSATAKQRLLNVDATIIKSYGVVSSQTAKEMAKGSIKNFGSDFAISITGIAGPGGGTPNTPIGTIWIGFAHCSGWCDAILIKANGTRQNIIKYAVKKALSILLESVCKFNSS